MIATRREIGVLLDVIASNKGTSSAVIAKKYRGFHYCSWILCTSMELSSSKSIVDTHHLHAAVQMAQLCELQCLAAPYLWPPSIFAVDIKYLTDVFDFFTTQIEIELRIIPAAPGDCDRSAKHAAIMQTPPGYANVAQLMLEMRLDNRICQMCRIGECADW